MPEPQVFVAARIGARCRACARDGLETRRGGEGGRAAAKRLAQAARRTVRGPLAGQLQVLSKCWLHAQGAADIVPPVMVRTAKREDETLVKNRQVEFPRIERGLRRRPRSCA